jgi:hypothetical protein
MAASVEVSLMLKMRLSRGMVVVTSAAIVCESGER